MAHVGVKGFRASQGEDHRAHRQERLHRFLNEERSGVNRIDHRQRDFRPPEDMHHAERSKSTEIDEHHRPEHEANARGAARLNREQSDEDPQRDWNDKGLEPGIDRRETLDRR